MATYYVTTAIDYPNGEPHIGHALEKVATDAQARFRRLRGDDVFFSTGLDENSQHVLQAAHEHGMAPKVWVDRLDAEFRLAWEKLGIRPNRWIRTSEPAHHRAARALFRRSQENGDVYKGRYAGWYCPNDNTFWAEDELIDGQCPVHGIPVVWVEEENYFFALSKYQDRLRKLHTDRPDFIYPATWRAEVLALLERGLVDFSVSRQVPAGAGAPRWGVPVPGDESQVIYVWYDALTNYLTSVGFPDDPALFGRYWPATAHVIGKDITRFHCLYWPAMLLSAGLPLPEQVVVHGHLTVEGQRISKSRGNAIDPVDLVDQLGTDPVRYYLLRDFSFSQDGEFRRSSLIHRYNGDLANDLGNLLNRTATLALRHLGGNLPPPEDARTGPLAPVAAAAREQVEAATLTWDFPRALEAAWTLVRRANLYAEETAPWRLAKQPAQRARFAQVLANLAECVRILALFVAPAMPTTADRILAQLGLPPVQSGDWQSAVWGARASGLRVVGGPVLFPRVAAV
jgi:methionyl-tRNA synthetase